MQNLGGVILKDLIPKEKRETWYGDWAEAVKEAKITKGDDKITVNMKFSDTVLVLRFELDSQNKTIRLIKQARTRREEEKILPVRYYFSLEQEGEATKRYVFFVPGEHVDTWYEYTPTGALHVEKGEKPSMW